MYIYMYIYIIFFIYCQLKNVLKQPSLLRMAFLEMDYTEDMVVGHTKILPDDNDELGTLSCDFECFFKPFS